MKEGRKNMSKEVELEKQVKVLTDDVRRLEQTVLRLEALIGKRILRQVTKSSRPTKELISVEDFDPTKYI